jgi:type 1 glutamine amidotransferase
MQSKLRFGFLAIGLAAGLGWPACTGSEIIRPNTGSAGTGQVGHGGNQGTGDVTGSVAGTSGSAGSAGNDGTAGTGIEPGTAGTGGSTGNGPGDAGTSGSAGASATGGGGGGGTMGAAGTTGTAGAGGSSRGGTTGTAGTAGTSATGTGGTGATGPIQVLIWNNALVYGHAARVGAISLLKARETTDNIKFDTTYAHTGNVTEGASDTSFDASVFTDAGLDKYDVVFFLDTTGNTIDDSQKTARRQALQDFIEKKGRGFVGTHSATDTYQGGSWAWYVNFLGANFDNHSTAGTSGTAIWYNNTSHPILTAAGTPNPWNRSEEWYTFKSKPESIAGIKLLLTCHDVMMTQERPTAWVHEMPVMAPATRGGRMFYTAFGHATSAFQEKQVMDLIIAGIKWAAYRL